MAYSNASELELDKVHRLAECNKNKRKMNEERWHATPCDGGGGGSTLSTVSWGGWTLTLIGVMIGTKEPSIAPTTFSPAATGGDLAKIPPKPGYC